MRLRPRDAHARARGRSLVRWRDVHRPPYASDTHDDLTMDEIHVSAEQYEKMAEELREAERKLARAREAVGEAASFGDLSENAEYDAARRDRLVRGAVRVPSRSHRALAHR